MDISTVLDNLYKAHESVKRSPKKRKALETLLVEEYKKCLENPVSEATVKFHKMGACGLITFSMINGYDRFLELILGNNEVRPLKPDLPAACGVPSAITIACLAIALRMPNLASLIKKLIEMQNNTVNPGPHPWSMQQQFSSPEELMVQILRCKMQKIPMDIAFKGNERKANFMDFMHLCSASMASNNFHIIDDVIWDFAVTNGINMERLILGIVRAAAVSGDRQRIQKSVSMAKEKKFSPTYITYLWNVILTTVRSDRHESSHTCIEVDHVLSEWALSGDKIIVATLPEGWGKPAACATCAKYLQVHPHDILPVGKNNEFTHWYDYGISEPYSIRSDQNLPDGTKVAVCLHYDAKNTGNRHHGTLLMHTRKKCPCGAVSIMFSQ
jgi:hypothetical protein